MTEAMDSGLDKVVLDLSQLKSADIHLVRLGLNAIQLCQELAIRHTLIGSQAVASECRNYGETKDWRFVSTFEEALSLLNGKSASASVAAASVNAPVPA